MIIVFVGDFFYFIIFILAERSWQSGTKILRQSTKTNAFKLTIVFFICMKTPFSFVVNPSPPPPKQCWKTLRGCLFVSDIEKGGRGSCPSRGERVEFAPRKEVGSFHVSKTTFDYGCSSMELVQLVWIHPWEFSSSQKMVLLRNVPLFLRYHNYLEFQCSLGLICSSSTVSVVFCCKTETLCWLEAANENN